MQKSKDVKLRHKNKSLWGEEINLPSMKKSVKIDENGELTVPDSVATLLLEKMSDFDLAEGNDTTVEKSGKKKDSKKAEKPKEDEEEDEEEEEESDEGEDEEGEEGDDEYEAELKEMGLKELYDVAEKMGFKEDQYKKYKKSKKLMISFIMKNAK